MSKRKPPTHLTLITNDEPVKVVRSMSKRVRSMSKRELNKRSDVREVVQRLLAHLIPQVSEPYMWRVFSTEGARGGHVFPLYLNLTSDPEYAIAVGVHFDQGVAMPGRMVMSARRSEDFNGGPVPGIGAGEEALGPFTGLGWRDQMAEAAVELALIHLCVPGDRANSGGD